MANVLLANPLFLVDSPIEQEAASPYFPLGLLYLAAFVRDRGHDVKIFDGTFEPGVSAFAERLTQIRPDVVGISALMTTRDCALEMAAVAKNHNCRTVLGGPDPTANPAEYASLTSVDIVVHHEGEMTLSRILDLHDQGVRDSIGIGDEPGIAITVDGVTVVNAPRPPMEDLDALPSPARDLIDVERHLDHWRDTAGYSSLTVATSRGCPRGCKWCLDSVHGNGFRQRSPQNVAAEVSALTDSYDIDRLRLVDDVDGIEREWLETWALAVSETANPVPYEALYDLDRRDLPLLDVRDSL